MTRKMGFENFSIEARKVMQLSGIEAKRFKHDCICTAHILLAALKFACEYGDSKIARLFRALGVDPKQIQGEVEKSAHVDPDSHQPDKLPQTQAAKNVVIAAMREAIAMNSRYVGSEHIILGLLESSSLVENQNHRPIAFKFLAEHGMKQDDVRRVALGMSSSASLIAPDRDSVNFMANEDSRLLAIYGSKFWAFSILATLMTVGIYPLIALFMRRAWIRSVDKAGVSTLTGREYEWGELTKIEGHSVSCSGAQVCKATALIFRNNGRVILNCALLANADEVAVAVSSKISNTDSRAV